MPTYIVLGVMAIMLLFSVPMMLHFIMRTCELEEQIEQMRCENCSNCAKRTFDAEDGTEVFYQCNQRGMWTDTEPHKLCERFQYKPTE